MKATAKADLTVPGTVVHFVRPVQIARYGATATVMGTQDVVSRPYGTRTTLVDLVTATGISLQWPLGQLRLSVRP